MYFATKRFSHLAATNVGNCVQRQAVEELIVVEKIFSDAVDYEMQELVLLVEEQGHGEVANLLLRIFVGRYKVDSLEVAEVDVPSKDVYVQKLPENVLVVVIAADSSNGWPYLAHIFLLVVSA